MKSVWIGGAAYWCAGYSLAILFPVVGTVSFLIKCCLIFGLTVACFFLEHKRLLLGSLLIAGGSFYYTGYDQKNSSPLSMALMQEKSFSIEANQPIPALIEGIIQSPVEVDGDRATFIIAVDSAKVGEKKLNLHGEHIRTQLRLLEQTDQAAAASWQRADRVTVNGELDRPQPARNFGGFDYRSYLKLKHIHWILSAKGLESLKVLPPTVWNTERLLRLSDTVRQSLSRKVNQLFPTSQTGYMKGLLIGLSDEMEPELYSQFTRLGLTHVMAISGMHVAVVIAVLLWIGGRIGQTRERAMRLTTISLPFYILLTGASPSVIRAGIMGMLGLMLFKYKRLKNGLDLIGGAALSMLLWNPYYVLDVGFQLSFIVTAGLIVMLQVVNRMLPGKAPMLEGLLAITLVAQIVSFPLTIYYFNQVSLLAAPANLILVPLISFVVTPAGGAALLVSFLSSKAGTWIAKPVEWLNDITFTVTGWLSQWNGAQFIWPSPPVWWVMVYYTGLLIFVNLLKAHKRRKELTDAGIHLALPARFFRTKLRRMQAAGAVVCGILFFVYAYQPNWLDRNGYVEFLDVGQGDSIFIRSPQGKFMLIDGGGTINFRKPGEEWKERRDPYEVGQKLLVPLLKKRGVRSIDYVLATHEDADHIGGLRAVVDQLSIKRFLFNGTVKPGKQAEELLAAVVNKGIPLTPLSSGQQIEIDRQTVFYALHPAGVKEVKLEKVQNSQSVAGILQLYDTRLLLTGDMEARSEKDVLKRLNDAGAAGVVRAAYATAATNAPPPVSAIDILKIAHHGSKTSTTEEWLHYWKPGLAVISVGAHNLYGHPNPQVTNRLKQQGIPIMRTDQHGEVRFTISKEGYKVEAAVQK